MFSPRIMATRHHHLLWGPTGAGKSHIGNKLSSTENGQSLFEEGAHNYSVTTMMQSSAGWNGDMIVDAPGTMDSRGNDMQYLAEFVDFLESVDLGAVLLVYRGRLNEHIKKQLDMLKAMGLHKNIILVKNQCITIDAEILCEDTPLVSIKMDQDNFDVLKCLISAVKPIRIKYILNPLCLFEQPIIPLLNQRKVIDELLETAIIKEKQTITTTSQVPCQKTHHIPPNGFKAFFGSSGRSYTTTVMRTATHTSEIMVDQKYQIYARYDIDLARRFDGKAKIYEKIQVGMHMVKV